MKKMVLLGLSSLCVFTAASADNMGGMVASAGAALPAALLGISGNGGGGGGGGGNNNNHQGNDQIPATPIPSNDGGFSSLTPSSSGDLGPCFDGIAGQHCMVPLNPPSWVPLNPAIPLDTLGQAIYQAIQDNQSFFADPHNTVQILLGVKNVIKEVKGDIGNFHNFQAPPTISCQGALDIAYKQGTAYMANGKYGPVNSSTGAITDMVKYLSKRPIATFYSATTHSNKDIADLALDGISSGVQAALSADAIAIQGEALGNSGQCNQNTVKAMQYLSVISEELPGVISAIDLSIDDAPPHQ